MKYVKLNNGVEMPILGFGVFKIDNQEVCEQSVYDALMKGYRLIDTAAAYRNEKAVGKAIKRSGVPREEIFLTTKLWPQDFGYENAKKAFLTCLDNLGVEYLDLLLLHQCLGDYYGAWRALEELNQEGKIRAIGVSNFEGDRLVDLIIHNKIVPAVNQVELHPLFQQKRDREVMKEYKVQVEAWGPLGQGNPKIFQSETLIKIAQKYGKTVPQVILRWEVQNDIVVIPKSVHKERIEQNFDIWDFELSPEDLEDINNMDLNKGSVDFHNPKIPVILNSLKIHS